MPPRSPLPALRAILKAATATMATCPALGHVQTRMAEGGALIAATALDTHCRVWLPAAVAGPLASLPGPIGLPLAAVLAALEGHPLPTGVPTLPNEEFPEIPAVSASVGWSLGLDIVPVLGRVARFASTDDTRTGLNGVHVEIAGDSMRVVATDGHRLHVEILPGDLWIPSDRLLPRAWCLLVARLPWERVSLACDEASQTVWARGELPGGVRASGGARIQEGNFPDWPQVIPQTTLREARFDAAALSAILADCRRVACKDVPVVRLELQNSGVNTATWRAGTAGTGTVEHVGPWDGQGESLWSE